MKKLLLFLLAPSLLSAQALIQLPRSTYGTGLNDSALVLCADSIRPTPRTRACTVLELRKALKIGLVADSATGAARAQILTTARTIGGTSFNGSANIVPGLSDSATGAARSPAGTLTGTTLAATVTGSSLLTFGVGSLSDTAKIVRFPLLAPNGTAAAPSYSFSSSTGLGLYRFNTDTLGFGTAGVLRATLSASGNGASFRASGAGDLILGPGTGNSRVVVIQSTSSGGVLGSTLQIGNSVISTSSATFQSTTGTATAPSYAVQNGGGGGLGIYSNTIDTLSFATLGAFSLGLSGGAATKITGGAGSMTLSAGTGASRTLTLQSTTSGGVAKNTLVLADTLATFLGPIKAINGTASDPSYRFLSSVNTGFYYNSSPAGVNLTVNGTLHGTFSGDGGGGLTIASGTSFALTGGTGNMTLTAGTGNSRLLTLQATTSTGTATTFASGAGDTLKITAHAIAAGLTAASGTPNSVCINSATKQITENAATSCVVSSRRFKTDIQPLSLSDAQKITRALRPVAFTYRDGGRKSIGIIAEEADSVDRRLASRDSKGLVTSVNYEQISVMLLAVVKDQQRQLDSLKTALKKKP